MLFPASGLSKFQPLLQRARMLVVHVHSQAKDASKATVVFFLHPRTGQTKPKSKVVALFITKRPTASVSGALSEAKRIRWTQGWAVAIPSAFQSPVPTSMIANTEFSHARPAVCFRNFLSSAR